MPNIKVTPKPATTAKAAKIPTVRKATITKAPVAKVAAKKPIINKDAALKTKEKPIREEKKLKKAKKSGGKIKVVRDSFTMPQSDYAKIGELKQLCIKNGLHVKKSELLRAGLQALGKMSATQLKSVMSGLEQIKTGRPGKK